MKHKTWMGLLLAGLMLLTPLTACRNDNGPAQDSKTDPAATDSATTEPETTPPDNQNIAFAVDGTVQYRFVYPDASGRLFQTAANELAELLKSLVGDYPMIQKESLAELTDRSTVYLGYCRAAEAAGLTDGLAYNGYRMAERDGDLYLVAASGDALTAAVNLFKKSIRSGRSGKNISLDFPERSNEVTSQAEKLPVFRTDGSVYGYATGAQSYQMVYPNAEQSDFDAYLTQLTEAGYTKREARSLPGVEYAAYGKEEDMLFVTLSCGELRVSYEPLSACWLEGTASAASAYPTTGYLMGVSLDSQNFENGMAMFYLLSDGTFLVFDGGHNEFDADNLYRHLCSIADENGIADLRISAWVITHFHGDHVGAFEPFIRKYSDRVKVDRAVFGATAADQGSAATEGDSFFSKAQGAMREYQPDAAIVRLHTGQLLTLGDMTVEVLYTPSDLPQGTLNNYNDASMILRLKVSGKTVLMTGDAATATWNLMVKKYGSYLKSDCLQVPHHGVNPGGTVEAYDLIAPNELFWPAGNQLYSDLLATMNPAICKHLTAMVKPECIHIAGTLGKLTSFRFGAQ